MNKLQRRIDHIKSELIKLFDDFKNETVLLELELENDSIPDHFTKAEFKNSISKRKSLVNRNTIDRLFLEKVGILDKPKRYSKARKKLKTKHEPFNTRIKNPITKEEELLVNLLIEDLKQNR